MQSRTIGATFKAQQKELRWHPAQMIPRLPLTKSERQRAAEGLRRYLTDTSSIVKAFALEGLTRLAEADPALLPDIRELLEAAARGDARHEGASTQAPEDS